MYRTTHETGRLQLMRGFTVMYSKNSHIKIYSFFMGANLPAITWCRTVQIDENCQDNICSDYKAPSQSVCIESYQKCLSSKYFKEN
jgi:hypothetical protein